MSPVLVAFPGLKRESPGGGVKWRRYVRVIESDQVSSSSHDKWKLTTIEKGKWQGETPKLVYLCIVARSGCGIGQKPGSEQALEPTASANSHIKQHPFPCCSTGTLYSNAVKEGQDAVFI